MPQDASVSLYTECVHNLGGGTSACIPTPVADKPLGVTCLLEALKARTDWGSPASLEQLKARTDWGSSASFEHPQPGLTGGLYETQLTFPPGGYPLQRMHKQSAGLELPCSALAAPLRDPLSAMQATRALRSCWIRLRHDTTPFLYRAAIVATPQQYDVWGGDVAGQIGTCILRPAMGWRRRGRTAGAGAA